jgi:hypothetical protein
MDRTAAYVADMLDAARELLTLVAAIELDSFLAGPLRASGEVDLRGAT